MFTSSVPPLHYEVLYDFIQSNWNNNYLAVTDGYEQLVQAGPQPPANAWLSSSWDVEDCPF